MRASGITKLLILTVGLNLIGCSDVKNEQSKTGGKGDLGFLLSKEKIKIRYDEYIYLDCVFHKLIETTPKVFPNNSGPTKSFSPDTVTGHFFFDTGAYGLCFDSVFYNRGNLSFLNVIEHQIGGIGEGRQRARQILDPVIFSVGSLNFESDFNVITNVKPIGGQYVDGIFGWNFFENKIVEINYTDSYLKFYDPKQFKPDASYKKLPFKRDNKRLLVKAKINVSGSQMIEGDFMFDLGSPGTINLSSEIAKKYKLDSIIENKVKYKTNWGGFGGKASGNSCRIESIVLSDFKLNKPTIKYSLDTAGFLFKKSHIGILGNEILSRFNIIIDFPDSMIYLKPNKDFSNEFRWSKLGFSYEERWDIHKGWIVTVIYEDSNADRAGLKMGDIILYVNDISVDEFSDEDYKILRKANETLRLVVKRNKGILKINFETKNYL